MGSYLYCLLPPDGPLPTGLLGLDDVPVERCRAGALDCWISEAAAPPEATLERVRRHNAVVEAALAAGVTPLPLRFGQWVPTVPAIEPSLRPREKAYLDTLQRIAGAVEFGVRVLDPALAPVPGDAVAGAGSGTAYMQALAAHVHAENAVQARGREIAAELRVVVGSMVREERIEALPSRHGLVSIAHLVERAGEAEYRACVENVRREHAELRFLLTGPWPPYSFAP